MQITFLLAASLLITRLYTCYRYSCNDPLSGPRVTAGHASDAQLTWSPAPVSSSSLLM